MPFIINSLPKSGTHLLEKTVVLLGTFHYGEVHLDARLADFDNLQHSGGPVAPAGVDNPQLVPIYYIRQKVRSLTNNEYATAHMPYSESLNSLFEKLKLRMLLILRDPRDVVVSHAHYIASEPQHFFYDFYQSLSEFARITASIIGVPKFEENSAICLDINRRYRNVLGWCEQPYVYTTFFEKLVGPLGNGDKKNQAQEINAIAKHLGLELQKADIQRIAENLFGDSVTFRKGKIGGWRDCFSVDNTEIFKEVAGQLLIDLGYETDFNW